MARSKLVDAYIAGAAPFASPILRHQRKLIHQGCPEAVESIKWRHASSSYRGKLVAGLGAFKPKRPAASGTATWATWSRSCIKPASERATLPGSSGG